MQEGLGSSWAPGQLEPGTIWCLSASLSVSLSFTGKTECVPLPAPKLPDLTQSFYHHRETGSLLELGEFLGKDTDWFS